MKHLILSACAATALAAAPNAQAASFDIVTTFLPAGLDVDFDGDSTTVQTQAFSDRQKPLFGVAEAFTEAALLNGKSRPATN